MPEDSVDDLCKIGFKRLDSGDFTGGLEAFVRADELCPNDHEILHFIGCALLGLGRHAEAEEKLAAAVKLFPQFPDALADLGDCLLKLERTVEAQCAYREALEFLLPGEELRMRIELSLERLPR